MNTAGGYKIIIILLIIILAQTALTYSFSITRFYEIKASGVDIKSFEQLLANFLNGNGLTTTIAPPYVKQFWLGIHFSPVIYLLAPLYYFFPTPETLLFVHSFLIALAAVPIFFASTILLGSARLALFIAGFYLFNPFVINAGIWDFHEIAFAPLTLSLLLWAVIARNKLWVVICSLFLIAIKEHYGLAVFGTGLLWAWYWKDKPFGLILAALGLITFVVVIKIVMPYFSPSGAAAMFNAASEIDRFSWLTRPFDNYTLLAKKISDGVFYIILLLFPLVAQPVFGFIWLLPAMADGAVNILASEDMMRHPAAYHSAAIIPALLIAYVQAIIKKYNDHTRIKRSEIIGVTAIVGLSFSYLFSALPYLPNNVWEFSEPRYFLTAEDKNARDEMRRIIGDSNISAQNNIMPHISARESMYMFPNGIDKVEHVVLYIKNPYKNKNNMFGIPFFGVSGDKYFASAETLLSDNSWGVVFYRNSWLILKKAGDDNANLRKAAQSDLEKYKKEVQLLNSPFRQK